MYCGYLWKWSDSGEDRELVLQNVEIYDYVSGKWIKDAEVIYLCRDKYKLTIEIP